MNIAEFSVKRSLFVNLLSVVIVIAGLSAMFFLKREAFPEITFDEILVTTSYRGASALDVEKLVTAPLERELREVDDIDEIESASREGISVIDLKISPDVTDTAQVVDDVQKAVDRVTNLPADVEDRPVVLEITSKQIPVISLAISGAVDEFVLRDYTDTLKDRLEEVPGVAAVDRHGYREEEFWVEPDVRRLRQLHVSFDEIIQALQSRNVSIPGGKLKTDREEFSIKTLGEFTTAEEIEQVIIRANDSGNWLRVKDVAQVRHTFQEETEINKFFGKRTITLTVLKKAKGDAINVVRDVNKIVAEYQRRLPPEITITPYDDLSYYIKRRLNVLRSNGIWGFFLVSLILFSFLHPRPALFTALGIPIAMCATLATMYFLGISINLMTMFGLIIVLGMIVDDGIIISENVYRYVEEGMSPKEAAIKGTGEVIAPVLATIVTTIAAFLPLMFMSGIIGKFIKYIPLMVIIALLASVLEAFIILPSHLADFVRPVRTGPRPVPRKKSIVYRIKELAHGYHEFLDRLLKAVIGGYRRFLETALSWRYAVMLGTVLVFILCVVAAKQEWFGLKFVLFPPTGIEEFQIYAEAPVGTPLERMNEMMDPVEQAVASLPREYLDSFETNIGMLSEEKGAMDPNAKFGSHYAQITVFLTPLQQRDKDSKQIVALIRPQLENITGFKRLYVHEINPGPPVGRAVDVRIRGDDFSVLQQIAAEVETYMSSQPGIVDVSNSYDLGNRELRMNVDKEKAARAFLSVGQIAATVRNAFEGGIATRIKQSKAEEEINVLVRLPPDRRGDSSVFDELSVRNQRGDLVPLTQVVTIEPAQSVRSIGHIDGKRFISVSANVDNQRITSKNANALIAAEFKDIPQRFPGYTFRLKGEQEESVKSVMGLLASFGIAFLLIFMILATEFNSLVQPFIILLTIPFSFIGIVITFAVHGEPISFLALLGIVGLAGIVVNDSIVLVDFINKQRQSGVSRRTSIVDAGALRFRPVLLTTLTTVSGLSTVAYGLGGFDPFLKPMALAVGWGLFFATGLTLVVMPCIYAIIDDITQAAAGRRRTASPVAQPAATE